MPQRREYNGWAMKTLKQFFSPTDLTKGTPWKVILQFLFPIFLSLCFQQIYSLTDALIVGQYLPLQFAGVSDTGSLVFIILQFAFGCTSGFSVITSNRYGEKDQEGVRKSFATSIVLSLIIAVILTAVALVGVPYLLRWIKLDPVSDPTTYRAAYVYIMVIYGGLICQVFYNLICSVLRSVGDSLTPLLFLILSSLLNIGLDFAFILLMPTTDLKVAGAAIATVLAQGLSAGLCFIYTFAKYPELRLHKKDFKLGSAFTKEHLKQGLPLAFQFSILAIGLIMMQASVDAFDIGKTLADGSPAHYAQDGYGAGGKLFNFLMMAYDALGTAMLSYTAQNKGAGLNSRVKKGTTQSFVIMAIIYVFVNIIGLCACINGAFVYLFLSKESVYPQTLFYATSYFYEVLPLSFILGLLFIGRNVVQGLEHPLFPFLAGVAELVARLLACSFLPGLINSADPTSNGSFYGVCLADPLAWGFACLFLIYGLVRYVYLDKTPDTLKGSPLLLEHHLDK
jgi:Na+-driven multidrug efflux pump